MLKARHKFNAKVIKKGEECYASKKEHLYSCHLDELVKNGEVIGFLRQVPVHLPGKIRYVMDFLVFYADGRCEGVEVKGFKTAMWIVKKKLFDEFYPWLELKIV